MDAEHHLRKAQRQTRIVRRHSIGASEGKFQAPSESEAVQGCNAAARQILECLQNCLSRTHQRIAFRGSVYLQEFFDVSSGDEAICLGGDDHHAGEPHGWRVP